MFRWLARNAPPAVKRHPTGMIGFKRLTAPTELPQSPLAIPLPIVGRLRHQHRRAATRGHRTKCVGHIDHDRDFVGIGFGGILLDHLAVRRANVIPYPIYFREP